MHDATIRTLELNGYTEGWRRLGEVRCRFDVVAVTLDDDGGQRVRHIPAAFDASGLV